MLQDAFGCAVANRFGDLLDDDAADPFDLMNEAELEKERKKKKKKEEEERRAKQKKAGQKESQRDRRAPVTVDGPNLVPGGQQQGQQRQQQGMKDGRSEVQTNTRRAAAGQRRANHEPTLDFSVPESSYDDSDFSSRGGLRGRRGTRGGGHTRNSENFYQRGKREYDRHDGMGISTEKRGGRGPWNWGCVEEAAGELMETTSDAVRTEEPHMALEENPDQATDEDNEMVVQVAMEMTLDEWKALQEMSRPKAEFNIRKAENKIPSKAKVIHQSRYLETSKDAAEDLEDDGNFLRRSVNDITNRLDINFGSLGRPNRGGRGRGARGGQSVCPERAKPVFEREGGLVPNPDDPEDFPALSSGK